MLGVTLLSIGVAVGVVVGSQHHDSAPVATTMTAFGSTTTTLVPATTERPNPTEPPNPTKLWAAEYDEQIVAALEWLRTNYIVLDTTVHSGDTNLAKDTCLAGMYYSGWNIPDSPRAWRDAWVDIINNAFLICSDGSAESVKAALELIDTNISEKLNLINEELTNNG